MATKQNPISSEEALVLTSDIVSAFVSNNKVDANQLPALLQEVHDAVSALAAGGTANAGNQKPAVPVEKSVTAEHVICLEDGKKLKMLKRYLRTHYNMSPEEYRRKWGLPADYPMVAPNYSKRRSQFAKDSGLGRVAGAPAKKRKTTKKKATQRRGRPRKAA